MNKRGTKRFLIISICLVLLLVVLMFYYFVSFNPNNESLYSDENKINNPVENKSFEKALQDFDDSYVYYLLYSIKAYNLHNPPLSSEQPAIKITLEDEVYYSLIQNGLIKIYKGDFDKPDIEIVSTKAELIKVLQDREYVKTTFANKASSLNLIADKTTLFSKGYINLYTELTGKTITGSAIKIYSD